jgi:NAD(P)-dependent dehydrogenase (short-subunit alcohol dehydrogenase family)
MTEATDAAAAPGRGRGLTGKVALVTGASRGIGRAIARRLADDGARLVVNYRGSDAEAREVVEDIEASGGEAIALRADVGEPAEVEGLVRGAVEHFGSVDVLVNNAAIFPWREWTEIPVEEWDRVFAVNVRAGFLAARACYPSMRDKGWGRVISLSSATFLTGSAELMHYAASKGAVLGLTRSLARALGDDGITVNTVSTGRTLTDGFQEWFDNGVLDYDETVKSRQSQSIKRLAVPDDIVGAVSFLASDDARYMTGQLLNVDGGRNMY